jgi:hypothetical protein
MGTQSRAGFIGCDWTGHFGVIGLSAAREKTFESFQSIVAAAAVAMDSYPA